MILPALMLAASAAAETDCTDLYRKHLKTDLDLSYEAFDQTMDGGFRVLAMQGCSAEAADLIEAYVEHNQADEGSLIWHVAQLRASAGNYPAAIAAARKSLREEDTGSFRWNNYVLATVAFLERDRESLVHHRDEVASGADDHPGNAINLKLLDALIRHFDRDYAYATSHIE